MSEGSRSGVHWMRRKLHPSDLDNDFARTVLPSPGTSSKSMCPSQSNAITASSTTSPLPTITRSTFSLTLFAVSLIWFTSDSSIFTSTFQLFLLHFNINIITTLLRLCRHGLIIITNQIIYQLIIAYIIFHHHVCVSYNVIDNKPL